MSMRDGTKLVPTNERETETMTLELTAYQAQVLYDNIYERLLEEDDMGAPLNELGEAFASICANLEKQGISR